MKYTNKVTKRPIWPKRLVIVIAALVVVGLAGTAVVRYTYFEGLKPVNSSSEEVKQVTIERGATLDEIIDQLDSAGLIRSPWAFKLYVGSKNARDELQAGTYSFSPSQSVAEIVVQLTHGKVTTDLVTIIPGQKLDQIRTTLLNYGFAEADVDAALEPGRYAGNPALVDKPAGANLEGYIYPDSYQKDGSTTPQQIIEKALDEMNKKLTPELRRAFAAQGLSVYQAIILASVVEKEVSKPEDRAQVAQVFLKRLAIGMPLQSNATDGYPASYDTYSIKGLPPAPLSNVTKGSLAAVAAPAKTDFLYFVSGRDCVTRFSNTVGEHDALVQQHGVAREEDNCR